MNASASGLHFPDSVLHSPFSQHFFAMIKTLELNKVFRTEEVETSALPSAFLV